MSATDAQNTKGQAFLAKASIHRAMALFTQHWGLMHQLLGEEICDQNDRGIAWTDAYDSLDGMGHESINNGGDFAEDNVQARLDEVDGVKQTLDVYRESWKGFTANEEQAAAFGEAMLLLDEVTTALDQAVDCIRACLPQGEAGGGADDAGHAEGETGATGDDPGEPADRGPEGADDSDRTVPDPEPDPGR